MDYIFFFLSSVQVTTLCVAALAADLAMFWPVCGLAFSTAIDRRFLARVVIASAITFFKGFALELQISCTCWAAWTHALLAADLSCFREVTQSCSEGRSGEGGAPRWSGCCTSPVHLLEPSALFSFLLRCTLVAWLPRIAVVASGFEVKPAARSHGVRLSSATRGRLTVVCFNAVYNMCCHFHFFTSNYRSGKRVVFIWIYFRISPRFPNRRSSSC